MNVREEDRQKTNCPSRGLGIAAAAIGVGVGAALYYFFSKRPENPNGEGSTSDWNYERSQPLNHLNVTNSDDSYSTISEHETTDTSIVTSPDTTNPLISDNSSVTSESETNDSDLSNDDMSESDENSDISDIDMSNDNSNLSLQNESSPYNASDTEMTADWDVTMSSLGVPDIPERRNRHFRDHLRIILTPRWKKRRTREDRMNSIRQKALEEEEQLCRIRQEAFRERSWTLEECSICFDVMLRDQEVTSLACSHNFHTECIMPWLQEKQTCPNCRKVA